MDQTRTGGLLLVHAHPDDESITTGATMAHYAAAGASVVLLTCTLGEQGEILVPDLAQLDAGEADQLGGFRIGELAAAMRALGVADHRFLGGAGRFRDSGMVGTAANDHPRAFWRGASDPAVFDAAVGCVVDVVREVRPHVVITYDANGDYGHPDHIMAHRVTTAALERAADPAYGDGPPWQVAKFYWTATPRSTLEHDCRAVAARADVPFAAASADELGYGVADDRVTATVDATPFRDAKAAALAAHRTQISVTPSAVAPPFYALSNGLGREVSGIEHFRLVHGVPGPDRDARGRESDLFSGLDVGRENVAVGPVASAVTGGEG